MEQIAYCGVCVFQIGIHAATPLSRHGTGLPCKTYEITPKLCITPRIPHDPTLWCSRCGCERHPGVKVPVPCSIITGWQGYHTKVTQNEWCDIDAVVMQ